MTTKTTYRGYTIRKSGKDLYKIAVTGEQRPFFERFISVEACQVAIDCREDGGRVMTLAEHAVVYPTYGLALRKEKSAPAKEETAPAARLIHEELAREGRHAELARDMGGVWEEDERQAELNVLEMACQAHLDAGGSIEPEPPRDGGPEDNFGGFRQPITMEDAVSLAYAMRHVPLPNEEQYRHRLPIDPPPCDNCEDKGGCPECDPAQEALSATEFLPNGWMRMPEGDILDTSGMRVSVCRACGGPHHIQQCPEIYTLLMPVP